MTTNRRPLNKTGYFWLSALGVLLVPLATVGQGSQWHRDVLFQVPLNLTNLRNDITKVAVECEVTSQAFVPPPSSGPGRAGAVDTRKGRTEVTVSLGAVVQTVNVLVTVPPYVVMSPHQMTGTYECQLFGYQDPVAGWQTFFGRSGAGPAFTLNSPSQGRPPSGAGRDGSLTGQLDWSN